MAQHQNCAHPRVMLWDLACNCMGIVKWLRNPDNPTEEAQDFAKKYLNYVVPTEGDGNCFFRAVSEVASTTKYQTVLQEPMRTLCHDHVSLREAVVMWVANSYNPEEYDGISLDVNMYLDNEKKCRIDKTKDGTEVQVHSSLCEKRQGFCRDYQTFNYQVLLEIKGDFVVFSVTFHLDASL